MPVGLAIGGAAIGAAATIGSGMMAADAQSDAAQTAADSSYATAQLNNQLYRDMWAQNYGVLAPYAQGGLPAMYMINDMLGLSDYPVPAAPTPPGAPATGGTAPAGTAPAPGTAPAGALNSYVPGSGATVPLWDSGGRLGAALGGSGTASGGGVLAGYGPLAGVVGQGGSYSSPGFRAAAMGGEPMGMTGYGPGTIQSANGGSAVRPRLADFRGNPGGFRDALADYRAGSGAPTASTGGTAGGSTGTGALDAFARFREGTNYQWRLGEGMDALNSSYAANGVFESGAADKGRIEYGQNFASNELSNYMNLLAGQQAMGLSAAGAVAGVGTTYAGNVAAQNTMAGNNAANAALMAGQGQANMWGNIGQAGGQLGGALYQYGMGQMQPQATYAPAGTNSGIVVNPTNPGQQYWTGGW